MDKEKIKQAVRLFIEGIGDDPNREGVLHTPERVAAMCAEIFSGIGANPAAVFTRLLSESHDEIVLVKNIPFYSMCEHHLLPFVGQAHVAYLPDGKRITGLSKLARVVEVHAKRLQLQERLTTDVAETIMRALKPRGVMVVVEAEHLCMTMRGIKKPGSNIVTSANRGVFRRKAATRAEFLSLISRK